ncbi:MAG: mechanosensitive ion channel [Deltaproteobacteria bacterium]|nr:MAG: mechanosensitive ion channel [Deltaproteobacteria bacterium]
MRLFLWMGVLVWSACLVVFPSSSHAQNLLDLLDDKSATKQTDSDELTVPAAQKRLKDLSALLTKEKASKHQERWNKRLKRLRALYQRYRKARKRYRKSKVGKPVLKMLKMYRRGIRDSITQVRRIRAIYTSVEQSIANLQVTLNSYIKAKDTMEALVEKRFPLEKHKSLSKVIHRLTGRLSDAQSQSKQYIRSLAKINDALDENKAAMGRARKKMIVTPRVRPKPRLILKKPPVRRRKVKPGKRKLPKSRKRPTTRAAKARLKQLIKPPPRRKGAKTPSEKPTTRSKTKPPQIRKKGTSTKARTKPSNRAKPVPPKPRKLTPEEKRKLEEEKKKQQLERRKQRRIKRWQERLNRLMFRFYRERHVLLTQQLRDEKLHNEETKARIELYSYILGLLEKRYKGHRSKLEGGLFHLRRIKLNKTLWSGIVERSHYIWTNGFRDLRTSMSATWKTIESTQRSVGWLSFLFMCLAPFLLFFITRWSRFHDLFVEITEFLVKQSEKNSAFKRIWLAMLFMMRLIENMIPYAAFWLAFTLFLWTLELSKAWFAVPQMMLGLLIVLRGVWSLTEQLFDPDPEKRMLPQLEDETAVRIGRFIRRHALVGFFYFPFVFAVQLMKFPSDLIVSLYSLYFAYLLVSLMRSYFTRANLSAIFYSESEGVLSQHFLIYRFYPTFLLASLSAFVCFLYGYRNFSFYMIRGLLLTGALLVAIVQVFQIATLFYLWMLGLSKGEDGLFKLPRKLALQFFRTSRLLTGFLLTFISFGLLLYIWKLGGFKTLWVGLTKPFLTVQKAKLSLWSFLKFVGVFGVSWWASRYIPSRLKQYVYPLFRMHQGTRYAISTLVGYLVIALGFLLGLQVMGIGIGVFAVFAGVLGIGIGFGLQNIANNFISGLLIIFSRPISVGDVIEVSGITGVVREISTRSTTLETIDRQVILIPNADILTSKLINWSLGPPYVIIRMDVGVAYGSDIELVTKTLIEVGVSHPLVLKEPAPTFRFISFGASSLDFQLLVAIDQPITKWKLLSELRVETNRRFAEMDIEISFPQQDIHFDPEVQGALGALQDFLQGQPSPSKPTLYPGDPSSPAQPEAQSQEMIETVVPKAPPTPAPASVEEPVEEDSSDIEEALYAPSQEIASDDEEEPKAAMSLEEALLSQPVDDDFNDDMDSEMLDRLEAEFNLELNKEDEEEDEEESKAKDDEAKDEAKEDYEPSEEISSEETDDKSSEGESIEEKASEESTASEDASEEQAELEESNKEDEKKAEGESSSSDEAAKESDEEKKDKEDEEEKDDENPDKPGIGYDSQ